METQLVRHQVEKMQEAVSGMGEEYILHDISLSGAMALTNGSRNDIGKISEQLALLTALVVGNRLGEEKRHQDSCIVLKRSTTDENGKLIMPWETAKQPPKKLSSALAIKWGDTRLDVSGPLAFLVALVLIVGGGLWLRMTLLQAGRENATRVIQVAEQVAEKLEVSK